MGYFSDESIAIVEAIVSEMNPEAVEILLLGVSLLGLTMLCLCV